MSIATSVVRAVAVAGLALASFASTVPAHADTLLEETVDFTGTFMFLGAKVPALVLGVVHNGETVVRGYGEISDGSGKAPNGDTRMRVGSITKVFAGAVLASLWRMARSISPTRFRIGLAGTSRSPSATASPSGSSTW